MAREHRLHALWPVASRPASARGEALGLAWSDVDLLAGAFREHRKRQNEERFEAGKAWRDTDLVFTTYIEVIEWVQRDGMNAFIDPGDESGNESTA